MRCKHSPFGNRNGFAFAVADQKDERLDCCRNIPSLDFFCDRSFASKQLNDVGLLHTSDLSLIGRILENLIVVAVAEIAIIMATANYIKQALKCPSLKSPRVLTEAAEARADFELQEISKRNTTDSNCYGFG
jgi:hypothetical protein